VGHKLDQTFAVLNGLLGDYLASRGNGLAIEMALYRDGEPLVLNRDGLHSAHPNASPRVVLLVHGMMCTETVFRFPDGSDYGRKLEQDLGITSLYLRYNSGLAVADNGSALAALLQQLSEAYPVPIEELILLGYSMGGLLVRSACHFAAERGLPWLALVRRAIYVGTPHAGAPAERIGRVVAKILHAVPEPVTQLIGDIGDLRSAGVKDLGDADLRHEDRAALLGRLSLRDAHHPVPLLPQLRHGLIAASLSLDPRMAALFGDSIVPVSSATAAMMGSAMGLPPECVKVLPGRSHLDLAHDPDVYAQIKLWCEETR
jgi:pimeloyl-ACP methyl ester carboxylesterase